MRPVLPLFSRKVDFQLVAIPRAGKRAEQAEENDFTTHLRLARLEGYPKDGSEASKNTESTRAQLGANYRGEIAKIDHEGKAQAADLEFS